MNSNVILTSHIGNGFIKTYYESVIEDNAENEQRAKDLANIMSYDYDTYHDVNVETILRAAEIAGLIKVTKEEVS